MLEPTVSYQRVGLHWEFTITCYSDVIDMSWTGWRGRAWTRRGAQRYAAAAINEMPWLTE